MWIRDVAKLSNLYTSSSAMPRHVYLDAPDTLQRERDAERKWECLHSHNLSFLATITRSHLTGD